MTHDIEIYRNVITSLVDFFRVIERQLSENIVTEQKQCFEDPDDPSMPNEFKTFKFGDRDNYMTCDGVRTFNFEYVMEKIKKHPYVNLCTQRCLEEGPNISLNEYKWYACLLEIEMNMPKKYIITIFCTMIIKI
jgi:hypothetical protein